MAGAATSSSIFPIAQAVAQDRPVATAPATFVLVAGNGEGGWIYRRIANLLAKRGHQVFTPTLTGLGERSHLLSASINLTTHITDVVNVVQWEDLTDIVLCGHSYGGMVITGVAERIGERIASIVYLDALIPEDDQSTLDINPRKLADGIASPPPKATVLKVNDKDQAWVDAKCTPQPNGAASEKLKVTGAYQRIRKKVYVRAGGYPNQVFTKFYDRVRADPSWTVHVLPCGHDIMVDMPDELSDILVASV